MIDAGALLWLGGLWIALSAIAIAVFLRNKKPTEGDDGEYRFSVDEFNE